MGIVRKNLIGLMVVAAAALCFAVTPTLAFHDGGVAHCNGCHAMHGQTGGDNPVDTSGGNPHLLKQSNPTDTCLVCHGIANQNGNTWGNTLADPGNLYGGGQFIFLTEDNLNDGHDGDSSENFIPGYQAGHSIISADRMTVMDPVNDFAPGGDYENFSLHCTSCHDPHGQGGHFRILYGDPYVSNANGDQELSWAGVDAIDADGIGSIFGPGEANNRHTYYRSGVSDWCSNCHGDFHNAGSSATIHPTNTALGGTPNLAGIYNNYNGTGDHSGGDKATAYLALVPFEETNADPGGDGTIDYGVTSTEGPSANGRVMCLTCHRAHASSAPNAGRWDFNITTWADEGVNSSAYAIPNPYAGTAGDDQRSLCNKCHAKDPVDPNP
jgi:hypothetical protein